VFLQKTWIKPLNSFGFVLFYSERFEAWVKEKYLHLYFEVK